MTTSWDGSLGPLGRPVGIPWRCLEVLGSLAGSIGIVLGVPWDCPGAVPCASLEPVASRWSLGVPWGFPWIPRGPLRPRLGRGPREVTKTRPAPKSVTNSSVGESPKPGPPQNRWQTPTWVSHQNQAHPNIGDQLQRGRVNKRRPTPKSVTTSWGGSLGSLGRPVGNPWGTL